MTINREHLAPCPFCGGEAETIECSDASWYVICATSKCGGQTPFGKTKPEAIGRWNTRAHAEPVAEPVAFVQVTGSLDEIDAPVWPFINEEARKVGAEKGRIETYKYERANGGVAVLWDANRIHAMAVTIRDDMNRTRCIRMLTAPQHDAELIELLERMREFVEDPLCHQEMLELIDAKLATLRHV